MTAFAALDRIRLNAEAAATFPDIGTRDGVVLRVESGWVVVHWRGIEGETRLPIGDVTPC